MTRVYCDRCGKEIHEKDEHLFFHAVFETGGNCEYIICKDCHEIIKPALTELFKDIHKYEQEKTNHDQSVLQ